MLEMHYCSLNISGLPVNEASFSSRFFDDNCNTNPGLLSGVPSCNMALAFTGPEDEQTGGGCHDNCALLLINIVASWVGDPTLLV